MKFAISLSPFPFLILSLPLPFPSSSSPFDLSFALCYTAFTNKFLLSFCIAISFSLWMLKYGLKTFINSFSDGSCWEIMIIKQIHTLTSNILFEQRRLGLGCPSLYQVKWLILKQCFSLSGWLKWGITVLASRNHKICNNPWIDEENKKKDIVTKPEQIMKTKSKPLKETAERWKPENSLFTLAMLAGWCIRVICTSCQEWNTQGYQVLGNFYADRETR